MTLLVLGAGPGSDGSDRRAVALALYGADDPDVIVAAGFHGLGGAPERIAVRRAGSCRFDLVAASRTETVDFGRIVAIRYVTVPDPAAGVARSLAHAGTGPLPRLTVAILDGGHGPVCAEAQCTGAHVFALGDPARLAAARQAADDLEARCQAQGGLPR